MPVGTSIGVGIVCILYLLVNVAYVSTRHDLREAISMYTDYSLKMVVVPKEQQLNPSNNVALLFFQLTFGSISNDNDQPKRILSAFMAISSFGNIVVMTFTAARGAYHLICTPTSLIILLNSTFSETGNCEGGNPSHG
jgi:hypothetical protein